MIEVRPALHPTLPSGKRAVMAMAIDEWVRARSSVQHISIATTLNVRFTTRVQSAGTPCAAEASSFGFTSSFLLLLFTVVLDV